MSFNHIVGALLMAIFIIFVLQNLTSVSVDFLVFEITMPRSVLLSITLLIGILIGIIIPFGSLKNQKKGSSKA
jgi:uncharacterized integral membrane protein